MMKYEKQLESVAVTTDLLEKRWVKFLLFLLIPGAIFVLVSAGIRVSQYGIDHTIVVLCQKKLVNGMRGAMRITLIDDQSGFFLPERVSATLIKDGKKSTLFDGEVLATGYAVSRNFQVPSLGPGPATMELSVYFDGQRRVIQKPVEIVSDFPKTKLTWPSDVTPDLIVARTRQGRAFVRVYSEGRGAPAGLSSLLFVQTTDENEAPVSTPYRFELPRFKKGETLKVASGETGPDGLDAFMIQPTDVHYPMKLIVDGGDSAAVDTDLGTSLTETDNHGDTDGVKNVSAIHAPAVVYSGARLDFKSPIVGSDETIDLTLQKVSGGEPVYLDVFKGNQWLHSEIGWVGDDGRTIFELKPPATGILRIQVTSSPLRFSRDVVVRHVFVKAAGQTDVTALRQILSAQTREIDRKWLEAVIERIPSGIPKARVGLVAAFALSRLYTGHSQLPELVSSRKGDDQALNAFKKQFQTGLMVAILLLGAAVAVLIAVMALQASRKQRELTRMIMEDDGGDSGEIATEDGGEMPTLKSEQDERTRLSSLIQIGTLFLVILAAFAAIALLVMTMSWNQMPGM